MNGNRGTRDDEFGGYPSYADINWDQLDFDEATFDKINRADASAGLAEAAEIKDYFEIFGDKLPKALEEERLKLAASFSA